VENELQHALLAPYGTHVEPPALLTFEARIPAAALRAPDPLIVHLGAENDPVGQKMGRSVVNTFQPKSVVKYRGGHGLGLLRIVRLPSNKNGILPCPFLVFNYQGTRLPEDPKKARKTPGLEKIELPGTDQTGHWEERVSL
jgi:hypothetical protein